MMPISLSAFKPSFIEAIHLSINNKNIFRQHRKIYNLKTLVNFKSICNDFVKFID